MFVIGGVSGVMTGVVPDDLQLTDTYWVVAHLHYVLIGINLFGVLPGHLLLVSEIHRANAARDPEKSEFAA